jgi:glycosyltransferase involved in cell wall biosynthesis
MKIAILTNFHEINHGYSLTGIVEDQVTMLTEYGHQVHFYALEGFDRESAGKRLQAAELHAVVPAGKLVDYRSMGHLSQDHWDLADRTAEVLGRELVGMDLVFTHDWCFTGWNLPHFLGLLGAGQGLAGTRFYHWVHSIPAMRPEGRDWWRVQDWGPSHKVVYPNSIDAGCVASQFRGSLDDVVVIPHIKDLRSFWEFDAETCRFIDEHPEFLQADIVQLLPASTDRLWSKRVDVVISVMAALKRLGKTVCLVVANQWATGRGVKDSLKSYRNLARDEGLEWGAEVVFTSEFGPEYEAGISKRMVRELFLCSNLFVFLTDHESFGLVVPEACLSGVFPVLNGSLPQQADLVDSRACFHLAGSWCHKPPYGVENEAALAQRLANEMARNPSLMSQTICRQKYNWDAVYNVYYRPLIEAVLGERSAAERPECSTMKESIDLHLVPGEAKSDSRCGRVARG